MFTSITVAGFLHWIQWLVNSRARSQFKVILCLSQFVRENVERDSATGSLLLCHSMHTPLSCSNCLDQRSLWHTASTTDSNHLLSIGNVVKASVLLSTDGIQRVHLKAAHVTEPLTPSEHAKYKLSCRSNESVIFVSWGHERSSCKEIILFWTNKMVIFQRDFTRISYFTRYYNVEMDDAPVVLHSLVWNSNWPAALQINVHDRGVSM